MRAPAPQLLVAHSRSRDLVARQHAIFALGNLASSTEQVEALALAGALPPLVSFAFPGDANAQYMAVAGLRGVGMHPDLRQQAVDAGALEPLILAAASDDPEVRRETAATLCNLAIADANKVRIAASGCLPALLALVRGDDRQCQRHAVGAIANIAEMVDGRTQRRLIEEVRASAGRPGGGVGGGLRSGGRPCTVADAPAGADPVTRRLRARPRPGSLR